MYVLDEPSIGLHQRDNARLIGTLKHLRDLGNSVIVVEHDADAIRAADHVVDMGPGAGEAGGHIVAEGPPSEIISNPQSLTGRYLAGALTIEVPRLRNRPNSNRLVVRGATGNNLKGIDLALPLGLLVCVTGVSGSGKSTLINDTLYAAVARSLYGSAAEPAPHASIAGLEHLDKVISVDQTPIDVGLGYVRLGQSAITLSGGEAQRVKLSLELSKRDTGRTLYILDEPTTGLHFHDIKLLLEVLHRLRDAGNSVVVIEHNVDVIKTADWIVDLGPEGGDGGGRLVAEGTPEQVAANKASYTGQSLRQALGVKPGEPRRRAAA